MTAPVIAVDGPSGSGKGTLCQHLAQTLGWSLLDSGALYRLVGLAGVKHGISLDDEAPLAALAQDLDKLAMLGMEGEIDQPTLEAAVADSARFDVFALPEACLAGDLPRARRIAERLQAEGAPTPLLNFALARDLRSLVQLSRGKSPQAAGVWGWRSSLFEQAKRRLNGRTLLRLYFAMAGLDRAAKSRPESVYWEELLNFVHVFAGPASAQRLPLAIHEHTEPC